MRKHFLRFNHLYTNSLTILQSVLKSAKIIQIHFRKYIFGTIILEVVVFVRLCLSVCLCERRALSINLQYV